MKNSAEVQGIDAFTGAFRRHAAGVAVVTSVAPDGRPVGFTATSLASLAAVPPLATFNMAQVSSSWPAITVGNLVAIHMLGPRSRHLAQRMAADHDLRFVGNHWHVGADGVPLLNDATAIAIGRIIDVHPVHNNAIVVVEIDHGFIGDEDDALLYHERTYMRPQLIQE
ncbi:MAG: flavin reductase family protein [Rhodoglobus sp.]